MPHTTVLPEQPTAVRRAVLSPDQLMDWVPRACTDVASYLYHHGIAPSGYAYARSHLLRDDLIRVEAGFPIAAPITTANLVEPSTLPGGPALVEWYTGP